MKRLSTLKCQYCSIVISGSIPHCVAGDPACRHAENICHTCQKQGKHNVAKYCVTCHKTAAQQQAKQQATLPVDIRVEVAGYSKKYIHQFLEKIASIEERSQDKQIYYIQGEKKYNFFFSDGKPAGAAAQPYAITLYCVHCCDNEHSIEKQTQLILAPVLLKQTTAVVLAIHPGDSAEEEHDFGAWRRTVQGPQCMMGQAPFVRRNASMLHVLLDDAHLMRDLLSHLVGSFTGQQNNTVVDCVEISEQAVVDCTAGL